MQEYPWLSSYPEGVTWDHMIDAKPVYRILNNAVAQFPDRIAIDFYGNTWTYVELKSLVNRAAKGLHELGVKRGVRVGILLPNCPQFIISYYAILRAGGTAVLLSPLCSEKELTHQIKECDIGIVITLDMKMCYGKLASIAGAASLRHVVVGSLRDVLPFPKNILFPILKRRELTFIPDDSRHVRWETLLDQQGDDEFEADVVEPQEDIAVIQYTGGTTGTPKGAMLTHANLFANTMQCALWFPQLQPGKERMLAVLPFFHIFAMTAVMNFSIMTGSTLILLPKFEIKEALKTIHKKKPTLMHGVPTMYTAINHYPQLKRYDLSSLKASISGGAPLPIEVRRAFQELTGCTLVEGYGLTEASPVACVNPVVGKQKDGSIGLPVPQTIVTIRRLDNPDVILPPGEKGELCIQGPQVMRGYFKREEETKATLRDGVLHTGDIATIDNEGYVFIVDRIKEMIITGGFNVYPRNVEEALYEHPAVKEAAVVGVPDEYRGQAVKAFVAFKEGIAVGNKELIDYLKDKLAKYEIPREIEIRKSLPKTMIGKISKKDL